MKRFPSRIIGLLILSLPFPVGISSQQKGSPEQAVTFRPEDVLTKLQRFSLGPFKLRKKAASTACLDQECSLVGVSYHSEVVIGPVRELRGERVVETYLASGPEDEGAMWIKNPYGPDILYVPVHDFAIYRLARPLSRKGMHGIPFCTRELVPGEEVTVYGYPHGGKLAEFHGTFYAEASDGILGFTIGKSTDGRVAERGVSGGIVVNKEGQLVGPVFEFDGEHSRILAVPVWVVADFLKKVQPEAYAKLFPAPGEIYRPDKPTLFDWSAEASLLGDNSDASARGVVPTAILPRSYLRPEGNKSIPPTAREGALVRRTGEPLGVQILRKKAWQMVTDIDIVGLQVTAFGGGKTGSRPSEVVRHEIRVAGGRQTYRKLPDGKKEIEDPPRHSSNRGVDITVAWADFPTRIGTEPRLKIKPFGERDLDGRRMKIFRYEGTIEDDVCEFGFDYDRIFYVSHWEGAVACHGEIMTDEELNILRIEETLELPGKKVHWDRMKTVILYGWVEWPDLERRLFPVEIFEQAESDRDGGQMYWCRAVYTQIRRFHVGIQLTSPK